MLFVASEKAPAKTVTHPPLRSDGPLGTRPSAAGLSLLRRRGCAPSEASVDLSRMPRALRSLLKALAKAVSKRTREPPRKKRIKVRRIRSFEHRSDAPMQPPVSDDLALEMEAL